MSNKPLKIAASYESTSNAASYTDLAGAYLDLDAGGTYAQVGGKGPGSIGVKIRTVLAGVALTVMTFTAAGLATINGGLNVDGGAINNIVGIGNAVNGSGAGISLQSGSTHYSWLVAGQYNSGATLEFTPSTAVGGTTYTTPLLSLTVGGLALFRLPPVVSIPGAANDAEFATQVWDVGADATLGPLDVRLVMVPSATPGNRFARFSVDDNTGYRQLNLEASPLWLNQVSGATVALGGPLQLASAYVAGAPTVTGYMTWRDSTGTTYKVAVGT